MNVHSTSAYARNAAALQAVLCATPPAVCPDLFVTTHLPAPPPPRPFVHTRARRYRGPGRRERPGRFHI
ncbi:hypothetical protein KIN20_005045 [Parelaphostrongylus tenuis]|uniref:Uncharacterized protein n=1 Tax=Parelaphostrongylus tenuis TaxID=148309 RepID=A0AAD5LZG7_PARTN|nr:hypothetical protein KIN20_005045 [Parelaphostrongylus tenuis]